MLDINGKVLQVGQTVVVASKDISIANVPILKKGLIEEIHEESSESYNNSYIKIRYEDSGRLSTIDGYMYMTHKRFCII